MSTITYDVVEIRKFMDSIKSGTLIVHSGDIHIKLPKKDALGYCNWFKESTFFWLQEL